MFSAMYAMMSPQPHPASSLIH